MRVLFSEEKQRDLLLSAQERLKLSQSKLSKLLGVKRRTYRSWLYEETTLPLIIFESLCRLEPSLKEFEIFNKKILSENWGKVKGGNVRSQPDKMIEIMKKIQETKNKKRIKIKNKMKIEKNSYVEYLENKNIDLRPLLATCLMTDGSIYEKQNRIEYATKDETLKNILSYFFYTQSKYPYTIFIGKDSVSRIRLTDKELVSELFDMSPSFKKSPAKGQSPETYLKESHPSVKFLQRYNKETIKECIRLALSTDGSINNCGNLMLSCSNPNLCEEWKEILNNNGIKVGIWRNVTTWSGFAGVGTANIAQIINFEKIGGFVPNVKVSLKSKHFVGWKKNKVLKYIINKRLDRMGG